MDFWTEDKKIGIKISKYIIQNLFSKCRKSKDIETGGILLGYYCMNYTCAIIEEITDSPEDSKKGRAYFIRGVKGLQKIIDKFWKNNKIYYLGEWHYHPADSRRLSGTDINQIKAITDSNQYNCPEPICIIVSKKNNSEYNIDCYLYSNKTSVVKLL